MNDKLGDRMKQYERLTDSRLMPLLPTFARVDGRSFHSFTRGMKRPYDIDMSTAMIQTALNLAKETNACMAYTQSDEITLVWLSTDSRSQIWFDGRHSKMVSQIAALSTLYFYRICEVSMPEYAKKLPSFDARVWQVPNKTEAANVFLWRELDAIKNSISMAARAVYSDKELHGKHSSDKKEMLQLKGLNWDLYPSFFKRGSFIQKRTVIRPFTTEELSNLPEKHEARENPNLTVARTEFKIMEHLPSFNQIQNKENFIFDGSEPIEKSDPS
jgi:tRNA(His) 5'-end guanylyltransferase